MMHIAWRRSRHDGRWQAALEMEYQPADTPWAKERARITGQKAIEIDPRHADLPLADLAKLYPRERNA